MLADTASQSTGSVVFFDFLGLCMIHYPEWVGIVANIVVVVVSVYITVDKVQNSYKYGVSPGVYLRQLGYTFLVQVQEEYLVHFSFYNTITFLRRVAVWLVLLW